MQNASHVVSHLNYYDILGFLKWDPKKNYGLSYTKSWSSMTWMIGGVPPFGEPPTYIEFDWYAISNLGFAQEMLKKPPKKTKKLFL